MGRSADNHPMKRMTALAAALVTAATIALASDPSPVGAAPSPSKVTKQSRTLAPGVTYTKVTDTGVPLKYYVVTIDTAKSSSVDVGMAGSSWGRYLPTSQIAQNYGAVAAVNGDFSGAGGTIHPFAEDGQLKTSGDKKGAAVAPPVEQEHQKIEAVDHQEQGLHKTN